MEAPPRPVPVGSPPEKRAKGILGKILTRKALLRKLLGLENPKTPSYIRPKLGLM